MIATFKTPAGSITSEVDRAALAALLDQLQAWANTENQTATVTIQILPASAYIASQAITEALAPFQAGPRTSPRKALDEMSVKELRAEFIERGAPPPYLAEMKKTELQKRLQQLRREQDAQVERPALPL
jgi:hypothetical protein